MKQFDSLAQMYEHSTTEYSKLTAYKTSDGKPVYSYEKFRKVCDSVSELLSSYGISSGDKVALYSGSNPNWPVAFFSTTAFGRVSVPILPDFSENEVTNVLIHSESKTLFVSERLLPRINAECRSRLHLIIDINTLKPIFVDGIEVTEGSRGNETAALTTPEAETLAAIIYTSGTTGKAKGVMLSHKNFTSNIFGAYNFYAAHSDDVFLSVLPLAHTYELSIGMLYPFSAGACVVYMTKKPTPSALKEAMPIIKPTTMLTVPLIIEKVYKGVVVPKVKKSKTLSWLNKHFSKLFCRMAGKEMLRYFGGRLKFFGIGGAPLDKTVEEFLYKAKFPYYIGYGLTESAPMLAGCSYKNTKPGCIGYPFTNMQLKLYNVNPETGEGEIVAKGPNIMMGYYKDPERTKEAFTEDGYFRTNDLATIDKKGRFQIKGRLNNMILGPSGENVYPEEIEKVIKDEDGVAEAIVVQRNKALVALIELSDGVVKDITKFKDNLLKIVNSKVSSSSKIDEVQVMKEPFIKTATQKIRRFLYKNSAPTMEDESRNSKDENRKD